jgi:hypothetical protein
MPFIDRLYESMAILFGNLATRVEHVNVLELILLKWTRVLAHTFKVYRALRKSVRTKALHQPILLPRLVVDLAVFGPSLTGSILSNGDKGTTREINIQYGWSQ